MKRWGGLVRKEWSLVKWFAIALIIVNIGIAVIDNSHIFAGVADDATSYAFMTSGLWFQLHMYMGIVLVAVSYSREKPRVDIWLHSPAPYVQLVGAKVVVATSAVACSLLLTGIVIAVFNYVGGYWDGLSVLGELLLVLSMIITVTLNSLLFIVITLFFMQVYLVLKSWIGKISIIVTVALFPLSTLIWAVIWSMDWLQVLRETGPIYGVRTAAGTVPNLYEPDFVLASLVPESAILTVGSVLLYGAFTSIFFFGGAVLFEKKVRL
ncbi:hypothetical protein [Sporosarcina beigongshangi]|uniref:hypothetical protein n=1 Tax=Sporosarcina beigongshangi TaxID=2782538 RepID=UPI00193A522B|nr:hypothetical protein [Sporosarcina beigongshangi]